MNEAEKVETFAHEARKLAEGLQLGYLALVSKAVPLLISESAEGVSARVLDVITAPVDGDNHIRRARAAREKDPLFSPEEAAHIFGISRKGVYSMIARGDLVARRRSRRLLIPLSSIEKCMPFDDSAWRQRIKVLRSSRRQFDRRNRGAKEARATNSS